MKRPVQINFFPATSLEGDLTPLHFAAVHGRGQDAALLIAEGADVNIKDRWGKTPLHHAAGGGHKEIVELLIAKGVDVNAKSSNGKTPLNMVKGENKVIIELLRSRGAKYREELNATGN